jgi:hypothetical protein
VPVALRRLSLETATLAVLALTIVAVACSSSWSTEVRAGARPFRAAGIVALCALALWGAIGCRRASARTAPYATAAALLVLAGVSTAWSVALRDTAAKTAAFGLLLVGAAALSTRTAHNREAARRVLFALLTGAVAVAVTGVLIYLVSQEQALQPATGASGARFRGLGENPNTVSMLFATALPAAGLLVAEARSAVMRAAGAAAFLLLAGSIAFSGSRGALIAACAGLLVFGLAFAEGQARRLAAVAAVGVLAVGLVALGEIAEPLSAAQAQKITTPSANPERRTPNDAEYVIRLEDEIGYSSGDQHDWLTGSGRVEAWRGALGQAADRPLVGYGFGTEAKVFVDRYEAFQGGVPENSFLGFFLQLGVAGLTVFLALVAALAAAAVRLLRSDPALAGACGGVLAAGLVLAFVQSYVYAVGNTATLVVWIASFLPAAARVAR